MSQDYNSNALVLLAIHSHGAGLDTVAMSGITILA